MKLKTIFAAAALSAAIFSCGPKEQPLAEKLVGQWTGVDSVTMTISDSVKGDSTFTFAVPVEVNYFEDSTFTAVLKVNDSTQVSFGGVVTITDTTGATFTTSLVCGETTFEVTGAFAFEGETAVLTTSGAVEGKTRTSKAILTKVVVEEQPAEVPATDSAAVVAPADSTAK